jgi:hypothetical protein
LLRASLVCLALAVLTVVAAGCGDDEETTVTVSTGVSTSTDPASKVDPSTQPTETAEPAAGNDGPNYFTTPSKNIGCYIDSKHARCDIAERDWKPTPEPASCKKLGLDYGQGIVVDSTHAEFVCAGDTALGGPKVLGYGESAQRGDFLCESEEDGVTCSHVGNGHGFFLSRQSFRVF